MPSDTPVPSVRESVWDYPRPPRIERSRQRVRVVLFGETIVETTSALRILETSHPPTIYVPRADLRAEILRTTQTSFCEWKGEAAYVDVRVGERIAAAVAWTYDAPGPAYAALAGHLAFYPSRVDACFLDEERVQAQPGDFYGGWITSNLVGPFKGAPGTSGW